MASGMLSIDQTPCRASYGLLTTSALLQDTVSRQKTVVLENIARFVAEGDRMAHIENKKASSIPEMEADKVFTDPPDIAVVYIDRPIIQYIPPTGNNIDISV